MRITVIMASFLGEYPGCASNREIKFIRAVNSFLSQTYNDKELIIVSDGCVVTNQLYDMHFAHLDNVKLIKMNKCAVFSGDIRNRGLENVSGELVSYLDTDDFIGNNHLENIINSYSEEYDWYYSDDRLLTSYNSPMMYTYTIRENAICINKIGTSSIVHKKNDILWGDGYAHDWRFIVQLYNNSHRVKKIETEYYVCHIPNMIDL